MTKLAIVTLLAAACSRTPADSPPATTTTPGAAATGALAAPARYKTVEPGEDLGSLASRLRYEASHRPGSGPRAEHVLDAIDASGTLVAKRRQYLGAAMHASYCAGGTTGDGIAISVCEYPTARDAAAGKAFADERYAAIVSAVRATRGTTVLTIAGSGDTAARALHTFRAL